MQPTPAPTSPSGSPGPIHDEETIAYPLPPQNNGSAPFSVLAGLFEKLSTERKPERRRRLLDVWFNVCFRLRTKPVLTRLWRQHWREEIGHDLYPVLRLILPQARFLSL